MGLDALMDETIARLTDAFVLFHPDKVVVPERDGFKYESPQTGLLEWMPGMRVGESAHIKVVGYHPDNAEHHDLPTILSTLSMYGLQNGHLIGVMDATFITAVRTGAASAVASRILAPPESISLGLIGCGTQAVTQLHALSRVFRFKDLYIYDTDAAATLSFERRIACMGLDQLRIHHMRPKDFINRVDILCTATSVGIGEGPVFHGTSLRPHIHINAVGSDFPGKIEIPHDLLRSSLVCPDFEAQALREGECQQLAATEIGPDLHTLVKAQGRYESERSRPTVFDSTGWALEDMVCMETFMEYAAAFEIGSFLDLETISSDCRNPYQFLFDQPSTTTAASIDDGLKRAI
ncbi:MAG: hypothetical protein WBG92_10495 [Thiohalocapsa sp.]